MKQIGLFGGTFDPPHSGHVALVEAALHEMGLDEVWVIPAEPVHRRLSGCADGEMRLAWLKRIFAGNGRVKVLDWEIKQRRAVAAVETLRDYRKRFPASVPWLLLGADAWNGLESWLEYPAHRELCSVAVFARSELAEESLAQHDGWMRVDMTQWRGCSDAGHWCYLPVKLPQVSATAIRADAAAALPLAGRVPEQVRAEIEESYRLVDPDD